MANLAQKHYLKACEVDTTGLGLFTAQVVNQRQTTRTFLTSTTKERGDINAVKLVCISKAIRDVRHRYQIVVYYFRAVNIY